MTKVDRGSTPIERWAQHVVQAITVAAVVWFGVTLSSLKTSDAITQVKLDTLQQRIGDALKPPVPEQVVWVRYFPAVASPPPMLSASPRMTAREIASLSWGGQGGPRSR